MKIMWSLQGIPSTHFARNPALLQSHRTVVFAFATKQHFLTHMTLHILHNAIGIYYSAQCVAYNGIDGFLNYKFNMFGCVCVCVLF